MPYIEEKPEKMFYRIGEVAEMFGVNTSLIRFWEKEFDSLKPFRNKKGTRYFTREDMQTFQQIFYLVRERGLTLEGAKNALQTHPERTERSRELYDSLCKIRQYLMDLKAEL